MISETQECLLLVISGYSFENIFVKCVVPEISIPTEGIGNCGGVRGQRPKKLRRGGGLYIAHWKLTSSQKSSMLLRRCDRHYLLPVYIESSCGLTEMYW